MRFNGNARYNLHCERGGNEARERAEVLKQAIVIATAIAKPTAIGIKRQPGNQHKIDLFRRNFLAALRIGFQNAPGSGDQVRIDVSDPK